VKVNPKLVHLELKTAACRI